MGTVSQRAYELAESGGLDLASSLPTDSLWAKTSQQLSGYLGVPAACFVYFNNQVFKQDLCGAGFFH